MVKRVLIVDDHEPFRAVARELLEAAGYVVSGEAADGAEALAAVAAEAPDAAETMRLGDLTLDLGSRTVRRGAVLLDLTRTEFNLLQVLLERPGQVMTRGQLFERVWGYDLDRSSNSLDVYIGYLRRKLEPAGAPRIVHTVRGVGFVLRDQSAP